MFGHFVIMYLFLGGCGSGMLLVASLWSLAFHGRSDRTRRESESFRSLRNRCIVVGLVVTVVGAACLLADLGHPEKFLLLFFRPNQTYLTFGTFVLAALIAVGSFLAASNCLYVSWVTSRMKVVAEVLCSVLALAVMAYTGLFLQGLSAVAFWDTWLTPVLFVLSAVSMGISGCLLAGSLLRDAWVIDEDSLAVRRIHLGVVLVEAVVLVAFLGVAAMGRGEAPSSLGLMLSEPLVWWFIFGVLSCGIAVPAVTDLVLSVRRTHASLPLVDALCIFGGFALRLCIVSAGLH